MAEVVAELAAEILIDIIVDFSEELGPEIIEELTAYQTGIEESISNTITDAVNSGVPLDQATSETLQSSFEQLVDINAEAAAAWAQNMEDAGYPFEGGSEAEEADFEDTDPDSDPDKGEPDTAECQDDPEGPECQAQTQSKLSKVWNFFVNNWGPIVGVLIVGAAAIYIMIGQVARWICQTIQKIKGGCDETCLDQKCNTALCNAFKNMTMFIRQYWIFITVIIIAIATLMTIYFKSITPAIVWAIVLLIILMFKTAVGNLIATIVCDVSATTCIFQGKPINCS